jgi:hypothetical protein
MTKINSKRFRVAWASEEQAATVGANAAGKMLETSLDRQHSPSARQLQQL